MLQEQVTCMPLADTYDSVTTCIYDITIILLLIL